MSIQGWVVCEKCWVLLPIGQYLRVPPDHTMAYFQDGSEPNSANVELTRALWKFHADHASHPMRTMLSGDEEWRNVPEEMRTSTIGGDIPPKDPSFEDYLKDWPG